MPRSYGFDHFTVATSGEPRPRRGKKPAERPARKGQRKAPAVQSPREATAAEPAAKPPPRAPTPPAPTPVATAEAPAQAHRVRGRTPPTGTAPAEGLDEVWARAGKHVRDAREGASTTLRAGRALACLPLSLVRALRHARHRG